MKNLLKIIFLFLLFKSTNTNAQLPKITGGNSNYQDSYFKAYQYLKCNYDFTIAYYVTGGWSAADVINIQALVLKDKSWKKILLQIPKKNKEPSAEPKVKIASFNGKKALQLVDDLTAIGFWSIDNDSLNIKEIKPKIPSENFINKDTVVIVADRTRRFSVVDGSSYHFVIIKNNELKIYRCDNPESYLGFFPEINATAVFVKAKTLFEKTMK
ncbi:hypothetical protein [Pedobacter paludis]|uniref:Peptidase C39-like domain-containing protein n=1 Tax=Pedobacter paludis TaxID=2203212 RepID=A0A317EWX5_9SPHI|nr:hypothetical protein [Pedobacter paludis]PWS31331.1 hypothetical protein DF947_12050 [Pedobacter paludis]